MEQENHSHHEIASIIIFLLQPFLTVNDNGHDFGRMMKMMMTPNEMSSIVPTVGEKDGDLFTVGCLSRRGGGKSCLRANNNRGPPCPRSLLKKCLEQLAELWADKAALHAG